MLDIFTEFKPVDDLCEAGKYLDAQVELEALWTKIPSPKIEFLNSYLIVSYGAIIGLKAKDLEKAWEWAQRGLSYSGNINLAGESEFLLAEVAYARADYEVAKQYFIIVKQNSGKRLFRGKNPEYLRLIED